MGHYGEQYEEMYERQRVAKESNLKTKKEKLVENVSITSFEGETETTIMFQYGKDFFNGDIVQIANEYGHETKARILEIVRSEDKDGYSVYPTFKTIEQEGA